MSLSVIPLTILGQITGVSGSGDTVLYQVSFKSIDGTPLYGVTAVWTDEQAEIEALAAQKPYGVWINPIDGTFTVKFAGYTYVGSADLTDQDMLAGITPIEFVNQSGGSGLPAVTDADNGKVLAVVNGVWDKSDVETVLAETLFDGTITITDGPAQIPLDVDVSSYPIEKWTVTVNDEPLEYNGEVFRTETETHVYVVGNNNGVYKFLARGADGVIPGDYQVKITGVSESGGESNVTYFKFSTISELPTFEQVQRLVNGGHAFMFLRGVSEPPIQFGFNEFDNPFYKISYFNVASSNATIDMYTVYADGRRIEQAYNTNLTLTPVSD